MKKIYFLSLILISALLGFNGCKQDGPKAVDTVDYSQPINLSKNKLPELGIFIKDKSIMYNNYVEGVGILNMVIRDKEYLLDVASIEQTELNFYPRDITTLDTVQRVMYSIRGVQGQSADEVSKWLSFDKLVPIVVEQVENGEGFGETLLFWMTKTPDLEDLLIRIKHEKTK